ncbi:MAG: hypothetical protein ABEJ08_01770 [Halobacteriaceae archaeon]
MGPNADPVYDRVVDDAGAALSAAFERSVTGHAVLESGRAVLLAEPARCRLALVDGVPVAADARTESGADALATVAGGGPYRVVLYPDPDLDPADAPGDPVDPGTPADLLATDPALAERTRRAAPGDRPATDPDQGLDAVEAFLDDEEKIAAIRERARAEAERRAAEWGLDDL